MINDTVRQKGTLGYVWPRYGHYTASIRPSPMATIRPQYGHFSPMNSLYNIYIYIIKVHSLTVKLKTYIAVVATSLRYLILGK